MKKMVAAVATLAVLGLAAGVIRATIATAKLASYPGIYHADSVMVDYFAGLAASPGTAAHDAIRDDYHTLARKYAAHPAATLLHVVPGSLFMIFAPLQLRRRKGPFHRASGRALLGLGIVIGLSGLYFAWRAPHAGAGETVVITVFSVFFLVSGARAWAAIRRRDIARHREWMIRFLAAGLAISTVRIVAIPFAMFADVIDVATATWAAMALGWIITIGVAEWWLRRTPVPAEARPTPLVTL